MTSDQTTSNESVLQTSLAPSATPSVDSEIVEQQSRRFQPLIGLAEQVVIATVVALSMLAIGGYYWASHARRGPWIEIEQAAPQGAQFRLDINDAPWSELSLLPGVGESLARRIVDDRDRNGPYENIDQLARVNGIGEKKIMAIREFVLPIGQPPNAKVATTQRFSP